MMRFVEPGQRPFAAPASFGQALRAGIAALLLVAVPGASIAQFSGQGYDRSTPSGSPMGNNGEGVVQQNQPSVNPSVDPIAGATGGTIQPVQIYGSDRAILPSSAAIGETLKLKPPAAPNEFERYVQTAIGRSLPRFGQDLLVPGNRDFAVPATATVPPDYVLNVGDVVAISLTGSTEGSVDKEIDTDGKIFLPRVGAVRLAGVRYADLRQTIANAVGRQYRGYDVTVGVRQLRGIRVYVTGFANNPGAFTVSSLSTMANAVLAAGGPSSGGSFRSVRLYRLGQLVSDFDLYDLVLKGDRSRDAVLQNEDTLVIPPVGEQVAVLGSVNAEAIYEAKPGETIGTMLTYAGGTTSLADGSRIILYRIADLDRTGSREIAMAAARPLPAEGGDLVQVLSSGTLQRSIANQAAMVRVEGEVARPGNYYVPAGTTLGQVMAQAGGISPRAYVFGTQFERASVRRQQRASYAEAIAQLEVSLATAPLTGGDALDAGTRAAQLAGARTLLDRLREAEPTGRMVLDLPSTASTLPDSLVVENNDTILIPPRPSTVGVFGAVYRPASFLLDETKPSRVRDFVAQAGGPIRAADRGRLFVVRANGSVLPRNRGALSARVLPGDVIFMPVKTNVTSIWARIAQISTIVAQLGFSAAALAVLNN